jgi:hypothetical protein
MTSTSDAEKLLLPALLAMDVYHRDEIGGLQAAKPNANGVTVNNLERSINGEIRGQCTN